MRTLIVSIRRTRNLELRLIRSILAFATAAALVLAMAAVAVAADPNGATGHGADVSAVARAVHTTQGNAHGKAVSAIASAHGKAVSAAAKARAAANKAAGQAKERPARPTPRPTRQTRRPARQRPTVMDMGTARAPGRERSTRHGAPASEAPTTTNRQKMHRPSPAGSRTAPAADSFVSGGSSHRRRPPDIITARPETRAVYGSNAGSSRGLRLRTRQARWRPLHSDSATQRTSAVLGHANDGWTAGNARSSSRLWFRR